jgi:hypothetical protein
MGKNQRNRKKVRKIFQKNFSQKKVLQSLKQWFDPSNSAARMVAEKGLVTFERESDWTEYKVSNGVSIGPEVVATLKE